MLDQTHCQICYQTPTTCSCYGKKSTKKMKGTEARSVGLMVLIGVFLVAGFLHVINWDTHSVRILTLNLKSITGLASAADYKEKAIICMERRKYSCAESELKASLSLAKSDQDSWARLGVLQYKMGKTNEAILALEAYESVGGQDLDTRYTLAKAYLAEKKAPQAIRTLKSLIAEKPETLQVTVTRSYVEALIQANRLSQAKNIIERTRKQSASFNQFMSAEYKAVVGKMDVGGRNLASH